MTPEDPRDATFFVLYSREHDADTEFDITLQRGNTWPEHDGHAILANLQVSTAIDRDRLAAALEGLAASLRGETPADDSGLLPFFPWDDAAYWTPEVRPCEHCEARFGPDLWQVAGDCNCECMAERVVF